MGSLFPPTISVPVILILWLLSVADDYVSAIPYGGRLPSTTSAPIETSQAHVTARYAQARLSNGDNTVDSSWPFEGASRTDSHYNDDPGHTTTTSISYYSMHSWTYATPYYPTAIDTPGAPDWTNAVEVARDNAWDALKIGARVGTIVAGAVEAFCVSAGVYGCIRCKRGPQQGQRRQRRQRH